MTSISSSSVHSPLARLQTQLSQDIKSGAIKSSDETALSSALTSIDSSLSSSRGSAPSASTPPGPAEISSKISDLVDKQVAAGTLTTDQGTELKQLFQDAAPQGGGGDGGQVGHARHGGHRGPPPPTNDSADATSDTTSALDGTGSTSPTTSTQDSLKTFLKELQASRAQGYSQTGSTTTANASLLFDVTA